MADYTYIQMVGVSSLYSLTQGGGRVTPGGALGVDVKGNYAHIADGANGLQIYNISGAVPQPAGQHDSDGYVNQVCVDGNIALCGIRIRRPATLQCH